MTEQKLTIILFLIALFVVSAGLQPLVASNRPVNTYSIVARDTVTGEMGVAVQSHWFSVGPVVPWAEAGVGAVATQSLVDISYGPLGLEMMRAGKSAGQALDALLEADPNRSVRQVAMIDRYGNVAAYTGDSCIAAAGHITGHQFSVQANLMVDDTVWPAMERAYVNTNGDLAERMLAALEAAQVQGGDIRGKQSAAILVVRAEPTGRSWEDRRLELRVEDHAEPVKELKRLLRIHRAYEHMNKGDELVTIKDFQGAKREYGIAAELAPDIVEIVFWQAVTLFTSGEEEDSLPYFKKVFEQEPAWKEVVKRLPASGLLPDDREKTEMILSADR
jgi:uncharacterized Ntn-hydrolase superfamily protein